MNVTGTSFFTSVVECMQLTVPAGINPQLLERAKAALNSHQVWPRDTIGVVDFSLPSSDPRFHVVDLQNGKVDSYRVAHGRGYDELPAGVLDASMLVRAMQPPELLRALGATIDALLREADEARDLALALLAKGQYALPPYR